MKICVGIFCIWEENVKEFINVVREVICCRNEKFILIKIMKKYLEFELRIKYISIFCDNYEQFQYIIVNVFGL